MIKKKSFTTNFKIIIFSLTFILLAIFLLKTNNNVYAATTEVKNEYEIPEEFKEYYSVDNYTWNRTEAKYWIAYHKKHSLNWFEKSMLNNTIFTSTNSKYMCYRSNHNQNHTYVFTRFEDSNGKLIDNIQFLEYCYYDEKGNVQNVRQVLNTLPNGNTEYADTGNFLSMNNIYSFDNGNGKIKNGAVIPGLSSALFSFELLQEKAILPCKIAYSQNEIEMLNFGKFKNSDGEISNSNEYETCNYLLYFPTQCIERLCYINIWWTNENNELERGSMGDYAVGIDENGNQGIYNINKVLMNNGYYIGEDGIVYTQDGTPTISWKNQMMGAIVNPVVDENNSFDSLIDSISNAFNQENPLAKLKTIGVIILCAVVGILFIYLFSYVFRFIKTMYKNYFK